MVALSLRIWHQIDPCSLSHAIFICSCSHYLTFVWLQDILITSIFCLSVFCPYSSSYDLLETFHLPSSVPPLHTSFTFIFCIPSLCSFVLFLYLYFHHFFIIPCPPFLTLTFSILHHLPYYSKSCSMKFFQFVPTSPACNCCSPLQKYNLPLSPLLV